MSSPWLSLDCRCCVATGGEHLSRSAVSASSSSTEENVDRSCIALTGETKFPATSGAERMNTRAFSTGRIGSRRWYTEYFDTKPVLPVQRAHHMPATSRRPGLAPARLLFGSLLSRPGSLAPARTCRRAGQTAGRLSDMGCRSATSFPPAPLVHSCTTPRPVAAVPARRTTTQVGASGRKWAQAGPRASSRAAAGSSYFVHDHCVTKHEHGVEHVPREARKVVFHVLPETVCELNGRAVALHQNATRQKVRLQD